MEKILSIISSYAEKSDEFYNLKQINEIFKENNISLNEENIKFIKEKANELEKLINEVDNYQAHFNKGDIFQVARGRLELKETLEELGL